MIDQFTISFVSALTALVASVAGPMVALHATRTQVRATVRSANRQRWIDEFRDAIAHLCSELAITAQAREKIVKDGQFVVQAEADFMQTFGKLIYTANKIRLLVNPLDARHRELIEVLDHIFDRFRNAADYGQSEGREFVAQLVTMSVAIIRHEWLLVQRAR